MKILVLFSLMMFSFSALAKVNLKIDYNYFDLNKTIALEKELNIALDKKVLLDIPGAKNKKVEVFLTQTLPNEIKDKSEELVIIKMKVIEYIDGKEKIISSPMVMTSFGAEAELEVVGDYDKTQITLTPNKI